MFSHAPAGDSTEMAAHPRSDGFSGARLRAARLILRIDGLFEGVLGVLLVLSPITGLASDLALPDPATTPVLVGLGALLLLVCAVLWIASRHPRPQFLRMLAIANGAGCLLFAGWVTIWHASFNHLGALFVLTVAAILGILAVVQARHVLAANREGAPDTG